MDNSVIKIKQKNKGSVIIDISQTAHNLSIGDVVYYSKSSSSYYGRYEKANASILETANAIGFIYKVIDVNNFQLITQGLINNIRFKTYPVGSVIYLGLTNGNVTNIEQIYSKPLGVKTTKGILINIQRGLINLSLLYGTTTDNNGFINSGGSSSSERTINQTAHGLSQGDIIYCSSTGYKKALANETESVEVLGIVSVIISVDSFRLLTNGYYETNLFDSYTPGTVLFLSDTTQGTLTDIENYISKPVATRVIGGIIIDIQRGTLYLPEVDNTESGVGAVVYKTEDKIGDIKYSADITAIRTDGYILFKNDQVYNINQIQELLNTVSADFITNYITVSDTLITFKNTEHLTESVYYNTDETGGNLYIKAFNVNDGVLAQVPVGNVMITLDVNPPINYLHMDGRECTISDYPILASYVYNTYGSYIYFGGDGILTFGLPNLNTSITDTNGIIIPMYYYIKYC